MLSGMLLSAEEGDRFSIDSSIDSSLEKLPSLDKRIMRYSVESPDEEAMMDFFRTFETCEQGKLTHIAGVYFLHAFFKRLKDSQRFDSVNCFLGADPIRTNTFTYTFQDE